jgi:hypothetical protein
MFFSHHRLNGPNQSDISSMRKKNIMTDLCLFLRKEKRENKEERQKTLTESRALEMTMKMSF